MRTVFVLLVISLFTVSVAAAAEVKPKFRSFVNGISCGKIVEGLDQQETRKDFVLMVGSFISGSNYAKNRDSKMDLKGMLLLTEQFCRQNPELPVMTALVGLDRTLDKRNALERKSAQAR